MSVSQVHTSMQLHFIQQPTYWLERLFWKTAFELLLRTLFLNLKAVNYVFSIQVTGKYICSFFLLSIKTVVLMLFSLLEKAVKHKSFGRISIYLLFYEDWVSEFPVVLDLRFSQHF